jgi:hypothetical protein
MKLEKALDYLGDVPHANLDRLLITIKRNFLKLR